MQRKVRVGAVSYLNTKPLIYGIEKGMIKDEADLLIDYPSKIASMLLEDKIDVGLVPVAIVPQMKEHHIISDYCIGSVGKVASVCLFSEVPLGEIKTVLLDYQSRTSVALLKVLIKDFWKIKVDFKNTSGNYQTQICGTTAGLVIGDRALQQRKISPFIYDLGEEWEKFTGLPFVYAAWICNKKQEDYFIDKFNAANAVGLNDLDKVVQENPIDFFDLHHYYRDCISFDLDSEKRKGMKLFLSYLTSKKLDKNLI